MTMKTPPDLPRSWTEGKLNNTLHYLSKKPCKLCKTNYLRYTSNGRCVACSGAIAREYYKRRAREHGEVMKQWRAKNPEYQMAYRRAHTAEVYVHHLKHTNKKILDPNWGPKDDKALLELIKERDRLIKETGTKWRIVRVGSPVFRVANLVLVQCQPRP